MLVGTQNSPRFVLFKNDRRLPLNGVARLPRELTINGVTESPQFWYKGQDASGSTWEEESRLGAGLLSESGAGASPSYQQGQPSQVSEEYAVLYGGVGAKYHIGSDATFGDVTTEDFVVECVVRFDTSVSLGGVFGKREGGGTFNGWGVRKGTPNTLSLLIDTGPSIITNLDSGTLVNGVWYHAMCFLDRSGSGQWYIDGVLSGTARSISTLSATLTNTTAPTIGVLGGSSCSAHVVAQCAMWMRSGWLDTHLQDAVAVERASLFWGWKPHQSRGTSTATVRTRASTAYLDKVETGTRKLYLVGNDVPRIASRLDKNGRLLRGYLSEIQITNLCLQSEGIENNLPWVPTRCSVTNTSTTELPNGLTSSNDVIHEDNNATTHSLTQSITYSSGRYVWSAWFKGINRNHMMVNVRSGGAGWGAVFNFLNGTVDLSGGGNLDDAGIIPYGSGWYRCWIAFTPGAAAYTLYYLLHNGATNSFVGLNQDSVYCWGSQVEAGVDYPTSYMPTGAVTADREEDVLRFKMDDGNLGGVGSNKAGEIRMNVLIPDQNRTVSAVPIDFSDGGSASNRIVMGFNVLDQVNIQSAATGGNPGVWVCSTDINDGAVHSIRIPWETDGLGPGYIDGVSEGTGDTDCLMPDDIDRLDVGNNVSGLAQPNCLLSDIEIFERIQRRTP